MSSISGLGSSFVDTSSQISSKLGASSIDNPASLSDEAIYNLVTNVDNSTRSSNINYLYSQVNESIYSGNLSGVQSAIDTYTQSLPNSAVYDSSYTAPSSQFLKDLAAIKNDAGSGNLTALNADLQASKLATPDATTGGISLAYDKHNANAIASFELEGTVNTAHYLASQGYTTEEANAGAIALTINSNVDHSGNTSISAQKQSDQISDIANSLAKTTDFTSSEAIPSSAAPLVDILESLFGATVSTDNRSQAYRLNNQVLASLDSTYISNGPNAATADINVQSGTAVSNYA